MLGVRNRYYTNCDNREDNFFHGVIACRGEVIQEIPGPGVEKTGGELR